RISLDIRDLGKRAKDKSLRPEEMKGSTFTVSNLGMFGIEAFTAVINPRRRGDPRGWQNRRRGGCRGRRGGHSQGHAGDTLLRSSGLRWGRQCSLPRDS
ncbi:MAG TPA: hypothetical protein ENJ18_04370, partial [Nannocystis exedens]|nr:hypothetical protein [Nannocystis exedens]